MRGYLQAFDRQGPRKQISQLQLAEPGQRQVETAELQFAELEAEEFAIPASVKRKLVVGEAVSLNLRGRPPARHHRRHVGNAQQLRREHAAMSGNQRALLVDEQGTLIAGHGRVLATQLLGITDVPPMVARGWTHARIQAYRLTDNQLALNAGWDRELLGLELGELKLGGFDLALTGFGELELGDLAI